MICLLLLSIFLQIPLGVSGAQPGRCGCFYLPLAQMYLVLVREENLQAAIICRGRYVSE